MNRPFRMRLLPFAGYLPAAQPESAVFSYGFEDQGRACHGRLPEDSKDHRGLPWHEG